jgi:serine/threonine-protein kinase
MTLEPGHQFDRYVIDALLGVGGMGKVYRATDTRLRRAVALKVLEVDGSGADAVSALREARAAAAIVHPNVTAIFDADQVGDTSFIVMELVPGTLLRALVGDASVPVATRLRWLVDVAAALSAAHQAGVVHRDVKPENVVVREDGLVKVLDFGIARISGVGTPVGGLPGLTALAMPSGQTSLAGTPAYMAPEQIQGRPSDGRADQFAWGVVAYELLTGSLPWRRANGTYGVLSSVLDEQPLPPVAIGTDRPLPAEVAVTVLRALAKDPTARFPAMADVVAALTPFASGAVTHVGTPPESRTWSRAPSLPAQERPPASGERVAPLAFSVAVPSPLALAPAILPIPPARPTPEPRQVPEPRASSPTLITGILPPTPTSRLRSPDFDAPVDVEAHLALLPEGAVVKGMFFIDLLRLGAKLKTAPELLALAGVPARRYVAFRDYPMAENMRLTATVARLVFPGMPLGQSLRRVGQTACDTVMETQIGRALFGAFERNLGWMLAQAPKAYKLLLNFGEITIERRGPRSFVMRAQHFPAFLETYQVGVLEGVLRHCNVRARMRIATEGLAFATLELELD